MPTIEKKLDVLVPIEGTPPSLLHPPPGCAFHPRCKYRFEPCPTKLPPLEVIPGGHLDACLLPPDRKREVWRTKIAAEIGAGV
jgi:oligopeptide/dipeptide ABC transporter ATP-binding protein